MSGDRVPFASTVLRALAVLIAVAGVVDPVFTRTRTSAPQVAVLPGDSREDSLQAAEVRRRLGAEGALVVNAPGVHDAARIVVGATLPALEASTTSTLVYAPAPVSVTRVEVPARVRLTSQVPVGITLEARRAASATVEVLDAAVVVAREQVTLAPEASVTRTLSWAPSSVGTHALTVRVTSAGADRPLRVTRAVLVDSARWRVLAYDARPSWNATFIRRALERDGRFDVRSRVVAVRTAQALVARATARTPVTLSALDPRTVDVIVVGAPEALPAAELTTLRRLAAVDGVPLVLLPDEGTPTLAQWLGAGGWQSATRREPVALRAAGSALADSLPTLRALVFATPSSIATGSDTLVRFETRPVLWRQPLGVGEVVVSGALDAWRFREPAQSAFDRFWRDVVATQAARRVTRLATWPEALSLRPGERRTVTIAGASTPRATWVPDSGAPITAAIAATEQATTWQLFVPLISREGLGRLVVVDEADSAVVPVSVSSDAAPSSMPDVALQAAWANAAHGQVVPTLDSLAAAVRRAAKPQPEPLPWHPMRSPWWMLPFALALGGDWWLRRRAGRA